MVHIPSKKELKDESQLHQEQYSVSSIKEKKEVDKSIIKEKILRSINLTDNTRDMKLKELKERILNKNYEVTSEKIAISMLKEIIKDAWLTK